MTPDELNQQKEIQFYASSVTAWFNTSLEHDKSILTLAAGGIGLLITLLTTIGLSSAEALILYLVAILCFLVALVSVLVVFRCNRSYIEKVLANKTTGSDPLLSKADAIALWAFGLGVVFTAIIGIATAVHSYVSKEKTMANENSKPGQTVPLQKSFNGAANLQQPGIDLSKSFNNVGTLQPQQSSGGSTSSGSSNSSSSSGSSSQGQSSGGK